MEQSSLQKLFLFLQETRLLDPQALVSLYAYNNRLLIDYVHHINIFLKEDVQRVDMIDQALQSLSREDGKLHTLQLFTVFPEQNDLPIPTPVREVLQRAVWLTNLIPLSSATSNSLTPLTPSVSCPSVPAISNSPSSQTVTTTGTSNGTLLSPATQTQIPSGIPTNWNFSSIFLAQQNGSVQISSGWRFINPQLADIWSLHPADVRILVFLFLLPRMRSFTIDG
jgi:hypothetical protein